MRAALSLLAAVAMLSAGCDKIDNFKLSNEPNVFYRSADHSNYHDTETYEWQNCGEVATVEGEGRPSCDNHVRIRLYDASGTQVLDTRFHSSHCFHGKRVWEAMPSAPGTPGTWKIVLDFDFEGVKDLKILIKGVEHDPLKSTRGRDGEGNSYVKWTATCTSDRDVEESQILTGVCERASIYVSWAAFTAGSLTLSALDGKGVEVYRRTFTPSDVSPVSDHATGAPGDWTVTLVSQELSTVDLSVLVTSP